MSPPAAASGAEPEPGSRDTAASSAAPAASRPRICQWPLPTGSETSSSAASREQERDQRQVSREGSRGVRPLTAGRPAIDGSQASSGRGERRRRRSECAAPEGCGGAPLRSPSARCHSPVPCHCAHMRPSVRSPGNASAASAPTCAFGRLAQRGSPKRRRCYSPAAGTAEAS